MVDFSTGTCYNRNRIQPRKQRGNMGRPKKEKPNRKDGCYEIKATIGIADDVTQSNTKFIMNCSNRLEFACKRIEPCFLHGQGNGWKPTKKEK